MDAINKEIQARKQEIESQLELLFKTNMKITDWDAPEADDTQAAQMILEIMQEKLDALKADVAAGVYKDY